MRCFEEPIDFNVASSVPREVVDFPSAIARRIQQHSDLIEDDTDRAAIADVEARVKQQVARHLSHRSSPLTLVRADRCRRDARTHCL